MFRVGIGGQVPPCLVFDVLFVRRTVFEAEAVVSGFEDVAMMGEPVKQGCGHLGVAEDACRACRKFFWLTSC